MKRWSAQQLALHVGVGLAVWAALAAGCMMFGSTGIRWPEGTDFDIRLERTLIASIVGAALASSGVVYQAILRNPLAEPYLLGVSSGAALAVYLWALPIAAATPLLRTLNQQTLAFAGAITALLLVFALAQRRGRLEPVTLLLTGVIVNAINGAIFLWAYHRNLAEQKSSSPAEAFRFLVGGIRTDLQPDQIVAAALVVGVGWIVMLWITGQLNVALLGESEAQSLGVRIQRLRWIGLTVASLATAAAMSISGPIGFVGLVCPHLGRLIVGGDQRRLLPLATALGAGLLALADVGSRRLEHIPVGVLTGFLGGPFFLYLLWRQRRAGVGP